MTNNIGNKFPYPRGSEWRKWDLHIHSDCSASSLDQIVNKLIGEGISVFSITDHSSIDNIDKFLEIVEKRQQENIKIYFLPGIELKTDKGKRSVHLIGIFPLKDKEGIQINSDYLKQNLLSKIDCSDSDIINAGKKVLGIGKSPGDYRKRGLLEITVNFERAAEKIKKLGGITIVHAGTKTSGLEKEMHHARANDVKELYNSLGHTKRNLMEKYIDVCELSNWNESSLKERDFYLEEFNKPSIVCSDSHKLSSIGGKYTWIKANPTFEGLKQIICDPSERAYIGLNDPRQFNYVVVDRFNIKKNNEFFYNKAPAIYLNPGLNCVIGPRGAGKSIFLDAISYNLGDMEVIDKKRNNYIGYFLRENDVAIFESEVKNSYSGEIKKVSLESIRESGFIFDYYHQKRIGYLADPLNEKELGRLLFQKIFKGKEEANILFDELNDRREEYISQLSINREEVNACEKEILKEARIKEDIETKKRQIKFLSKPHIKSLLKERNKIIRIQERMKSVKKRIKSIEKWPIVVKVNLLDKSFLENMYLSSIDPEGTVLPKDWGALETEIRELIKLGTENKADLESKVTGLVEKVKSLALKFDFLSKTKEINEKIEEESKKSGIPITIKELGKLDSLQKKIVRLKEQIEVINNKKADKKDLLEQRKNLIGDYEEYLVSIKKKLKSNFKKFLEEEGAILNETISIDVKKETQLDLYLEKIDKEAKHDPEKGSPARFPQKGVLMKIFDKLGPKEIINSFRKNEFDSWKVVEGFGHRSIDYLEFIKNKETIAMILEEILPKLTVRLLWRPNTNRPFKELKKCSIGERGTALVSIILVTGNEPLIIDQPEDDLDHFYLFKTLVPIIREVKKRRQLIFATHDANIVINGDAELILIVHTKDNKHGTITSTTIEEKRSRERLMDILEGSEDAFIARRDRYFS